MVTLLGPNGAGKTTALRALAGLTPLTEGHIELDGARIERDPAERRPVGVVFQDYLLFPHLSALDNVAFGPRCQGRSKAEARARAQELLDRMGLAEFSSYAAPAPRPADRPSAWLWPAPSRWSRASLLLDEPLAALDAHTRLEIRAELRRRLTGFDGATVLVTHDPLDAMVLGDRLVVIEARRGRPGGHARRDRAPRPGPTTWPGWSGSTSIGARATATG